MEHHGPWNLQITHLERKHDLPNLHDYVPAVNLQGCSPILKSYQGITSGQLSWMFRLHWLHYVIILHSCQWKKSCQHVQQNYIYHPTMGLSFYYVSNGFTKFQYVLLTTYNMYP